ncbi:DUF4349 domain-containing protein [Streptomyces sp. NBC_01218]|uniref:DUF4349 domain-containing protein n=1 Tax=Streptomyces sp. NBC_01218 TaxID=2903780 RepID=UPI002E0DE843|nr:DUF4349 domain-containing protein [Streptomyces sp. NBC_01218]
MQSAHRVQQHPQLPRHAARRAGARTAALAAGVLVVLLAVGGCGANASGGSQKSAADGKEAAVQDEGGGVRAPAGPEASDRSGSAVNGKAADQSAAAATHVIRTTVMSIEVKSVPSAVAAARSAAEDSGGVVESETTERVDDTHEASHLVLRVPEDRYQEVLKRLTGAGRLLSRTSEAKDVTDQVVDVQSRIATQRASVERVRALMEKAERLSDVVALEGQLSSRQADLESLLAQRATLADRTSLATVTLDLNEPEGLSALDEDGDPGFGDAVSGGWHAFVTTLRWIAMGIGAVAPFLAAVALLAVVWRLAVRRRRVPAAAAPSARPSSAAADQDGEVDATGGVGAAGEADADAPEGARPRP